VTARGNRLGPLSFNRVNKQPKGGRAHQPTISHSFPRLTPFPIPTEIPVPQHPLAWVRLPSFLLLIYSGDPAVVDPVTVGLGLFGVSQPSTQTGTTLPTKGHPSLPFFFFFCRSRRIHRSSVAHTLSLYLAQSHKAKQKITLTKDWIPRVRRRKQQTLRRPRLHFVRTAQNPAPVATRFC